MLLIGDTIKNIRIKKGMSLTELAIKSCISKSYLSKIENKLKSPSIDYLEKICLGFDVPIGVFMILAEDNDNNLFSDISSKLKKIIYEKL